MPSTVITSVTNLGSNRTRIETSAGLGFEFELEAIEEINFEEVLAVVLATIRKTNLTLAQLENKTITWAEQADVNNGIVLKVTAL